MRGVTVQVCVYHGGEVVVDTGAGTLGPTDPRPVTSDTLFNVFSVTKLYAAVSALVLVDQGLLSLETNVCDVWPEYAANVSNFEQVHCADSVAGKGQYDGGARADAPRRPARSLALDWFQRARRC